MRSPQEALCSARKDHSYVGSSYSYARGPPRDEQRIVYSMHGSSGRRNAPPTINRLFRAV